MDWKKLNVEIVIPDKIKKLLFLVVGTWIFTAVASEILDYLSVGAYRVGKMIAPLVTAIPALVVFVKEKKRLRDLFCRGVVKQLLCSMAMLFVLLVIIAFLNHGIGWSVQTSLFDKYNWYKIYSFVYYVLVIGFTEEFIYRVVVQDCIDECIKKYKFLVPFLSAMVFGIAHYWVGGCGQVMMTFVLGLIWGYSKYYIKNVTYLAVSISHGLYDFGILVIPLLVSYL